MKEDEDLIPALKEWRKHNGDSFSIEDWIVGEGDMSHAIGYLTLFWPQFVEYDDCVIIKSHFDANNFENWKKAEYVKVYSQIESVLNHIHILDLFGTEEKQSEINYEQIKYLGDKICEIYKIKLKSLFPDKSFVFSFNGDERLEAFDDYQLTFYQEKNTNREINNST